MAWIKVETTTPDKPEIRHVARACRVTAADAFTAWFRLWVHFDAVTEDGTIQYFTREDADDIARLPGIGQALSDAGWLIFGPSDCIVANWDRHNGECAKKRALASERQRRKRVTHEA